MPIVSVVIPTFNHRDFVLETCASVLRQTFTDFEIIIVNDGSPDDTAQLLAPLVEKGQVRYFEQPNAGQATARNRGWAEAKGQYIAFLDDDDLWPPDKLEWQVRLLEQRPKAALLYGYCQHVADENGWRWPEPDAPTGDVRRQFLLANWIVSPGQALIRRSALQDVGGFDPTIWGADDWDLYIRLSQWGEFIFEDRVALHYRLHETNASKDAWRMYHSSEKILHKHLGRFPSFSNYRTWISCRRWITQQFVTRCMERARDLASDGRRGEALTQWAKIVRSRPELLATRQVLSGISRSLVR